MLTPTSSWQEEHGWANPGPNTSSFECTRYFIDGDSIVEGIEYQVLRRTGRSSNSQGTSWFSNVFAGLLREEPENRKLHIRPPGWNKERLFLDFSVETGVYPPTYRLGQTSGLIVTHIDTIELSDGPHRRVNFDEHLPIVEGIGSLDGLMGTMSFGEFQWLSRLVCHATALDTNYVTNNWNCPCNTTVGLETSAVSPVRISPSPASETITIDGAGPFAHYRIASLNGRIIESGNCAQVGKSVIGIGHLLSGVYLMTVWDSFSIAHSKFVKE